MPGMMMHAKGKDITAAEAGGDTGAATASGNIFETQKSEKEERIEKENVKSVGGTCDTGERELQQQDVKCKFGELQQQVEKDVQQKTQEELQQQGEEREHEQQLETRQQEEEQQQEAKQQEEEGQKEVRKQQQEVREQQQEGENQQQEGTMQQEEDKQQQEGKEQQEQERQQQGGKTQHQEEEEHQQEGKMQPQEKERFHHEAEKQQQEQQQHEEALSQQGREQKAGKQHEQAELVLEDKQQQRVHQEKQHHPQSYLAEQTSPCAQAIIPDLVAADQSGSQNSAAINLSIASEHTSSSNPAPAAVAEEASATEESAAEGKTAAGEVSAAREESVAGRTAEAGELLAAGGKCRAAGDPSATGRLTAAGGRIGAKEISAGGEVSATGGRSAAGGILAAKDVAARGGRSAVGGESAAEAGLPTAEGIPASGRLSSAAGDLPSTGVDTSGAELRKVYERLLTWKYSNNDTQPARSIKPREWVVDLDALRMHLALSAVESCSKAQLQKCISHSSILSLFKCIAPGGGEAPNSSSHISTVSGSATYSHNIGDSNCSLDTIAARSNNNSSTSDAIIPGKEEKKEKRRSSSSNKLRADGLEHPTWDSQGNRENTSVNPRSSRDQGDTDNISRGKDVYVAQLQQERENKDIRNNTVVVATLLSQAVSVAAASSSRKDAAAGQGVESRPHATAAADVGMATERISNRNEGVGVAADIEAETTHSSARALSSHTATDMDTSMLQQRHGDDNRRSSHAPTAAVTFSSTETRRLGVSWKSSPGDKRSTAGLPDVLAPVAPADILQLFRQAPYVQQALQLRQLLQQLHQQQQQQQVEVTAGRTAEIERQQQSEQRAEEEHRGEQKTQQKSGVGKHATLSSEGKMQVQKDRKRFYGDEAEKENQDKSAAAESARHRVVEDRASAAGGDSVAVAGDSIVAADGISVAAGDGVAVGGGEVGASAAPAAGHEDAEEIEAARVVKTNREEPSQTRSVALQNAHETQEVALWLHQLAVHGQPTRTTIQATHLLQRLLRASQQQQSSSGCSSSAAAAAAVMAAAARLAQQQQQVQQRRGNVGTVEKQEEGGMPLSFLLQQLHAETTHRTPQHQQKREIQESQKKEKEEEEVYPESTQQQCHPLNNPNREKSISCKMTKKSSLQTQQQQQQENMPRVSPQQQTQQRSHPAATRNTRASGRRQATTVVVAHAHCTTRSKDKHSSARQPRVFGMTPPPPPPECCPVCWLNMGASNSNTRVPTHHLCWCNSSNGVCDNLCHNTYGIYGNHNNDTHHLYHPYDGIYPPPSPYGPSVSTTPVITPPPQGRFYYSPTTPRIPSSSGMEMYRSNSRGRGNAGICPRARKSTSRSRSHTRRRRNVRNSSPPVVTTAAGEGGGASSCSENEKVYPSTCDSVSLQTLDRYSSQQHQESERSSGRRRSSSSHSNKNRCKNTTRDRQRSCYCKREESESENQSSFPSARPNNPLDVPLPPTETAETGTLITVEEEKGKTEEIPITAEETIAAEEIPVAAEEISGAEVEGIAAAARVDANIRAEEEEKGNPILRVDTVEKHEEEEIVEVPGEAATLLDDQQEPVAATSRAYDAETEKSKEREKPDTVNKNVVEEFVNKQELAATTVTEQQVEETTAVEGEEGAIATTVRRRRWSSVCSSLSSSRSTSRESPGREITEETAVKELGKHTATTIAAACISDPDTTRSRETLSVTSHGVGTTSGEECSASATASGTSSQPAGTLRSTVYPNDVAAGDVAAVADAAAAGGGVGTDAALAVRSTSATDVYLEACWKRGRQQKRREEDHRSRSSSSWRSVKDISSLSEEEEEEKEFKTSATEEEDNKCDGDSNKRGLHTADKKGREREREDDMEEDQCSIGKEPHPTVTTTEAGSKIRKKKEGRHVEKTADNIQEECTSVAAPADLSLACQKEAAMQLSRDIMRFNNDETGAATDAPGVDTAEEGNTATRKEERDMGESQMKVIDEMKTAEDLPTEEETSIVKGTASGAVQAVATGGQHIFLGEKTETERRTNREEVSEDRGSEREKEEENNKANRTMVEEIRGTNDVGDVVDVEAVHAAGAAHTSPIEGEEQQQQQQQEGMLLYPYGSVVYPCCDQQTQQYDFNYNISSTDPAAPGGENDAAADTASPAAAGMNMSGVDTALAAEYYCAYYWHQYYIAAAAASAAGGDPAAAAAVGKAYMAAVAATNEAASICSRAAAAGDTYFHQEQQSHSYSSQQQEEVCAEGRWRENDIGRYPQHNETSWATGDTQSKTPHQQHLLQQNQLQQQQEQLQHPHQQQPQQEQVQYLQQQQQLLNGIVASGCYTKSCLPHTTYQIPPQDIPVGARIAGGDLSVAASTACTESLVAGGICVDEMRISHDSSAGEIAFVRGRKEQREKRNEGRAFPDLTHVAMGNTEEVSSHANNGIGNNVYGVAPPGREMTVAATSSSRPPHLAGRNIPIDQRIPAVADVEEERQQQTQRKEVYYCYIGDQDGNISERKGKGKENAAIGIATEQQRNALSIIYNSKRHPGCEVTTRGTKTGRGTGGSTATSERRKRTGKCARGGGNYLHQRYETPVCCYDGISYMPGYMNPYFYRGPPPPLEHSLPAPGGIRRVRHFYLDEKKVAIADEEEGGYRGHNQWHFFQQEQQQEEWNMRQQQQQRMEATGASVHQQYPFVKKEKPRQRQLHSEEDVARDENVVQEEIEEISRSHKKTGKERQQEQQYVKQEKREEEEERAVLNTSLSLSSSRELSQPSTQGNERDNGVRSVAIAAACSAGASSTTATPPGNMTYRGSVSSAGREGERSDSSQSSRDDRKPSVEKIHEWRAMPSCNNTAVLWSEGRDGCVAAANSGGGGEIGGGGGGKKGKRHVTMHSSRRSSFSHPHFLETHRRQQQRYAYLQQYEHMQQPQQQQQQQRYPVCYHHLASQQSLQPGHHRQSEYWQSQHYHLQQQHCLPYPISSSQQPQQHYHYSCNTAPQHQHYYTHHNMQQPLRYMCCDPSEQQHRRGRDLLLPWGRDIDGTSTYTHRKTRGGREYKQHPMFFHTTATFAGPGGGEERTATRTTTGAAVIRKSDWTSRDGGSIAVCRSYRGGDGKEHSSSFVSKNNPEMIVSRGDRDGHHTYGTVENHHVSSCDKGENVSGGRERGGSRDKACTGRVVEEKKKRNLGTRERKKSMHAEQLISTETLSEQPQHYRVLGKEELLHQQQRLKRIYGEGGREEEEEGGGGIRGRRYRDGSAEENTYHETEEKEQEESAKRLSSSRGRPGILSATGRAGIAHAENVLLHRAHWENKKKEEDYRNEHMKKRNHSRFHPPPSAKQSITTPCPNLQLSEFPSLSISVATAKSHAKHNGVPSLKRSGRCRWTDAEKDSVTHELPVASLETSYQQTSRNIEEIQDTGCSTKEDSSNRTRRDAAARWTRFSPRQQQHQILENSTSINASSTNSSSSSSSLDSFNSSVCFEGDSSSNTSSRGHTKKHQQGGLKKQGDGQHFP